jgi:glycosyltransferase involved in cell wall biosynthesis
MYISALCSIYAGTTSKDLYAALQSIAKQTRQPDETVAVLDGPVSAETLSVLDEFIERLQIRVVPFKQQRGLGFALRDGVLACSGECIARFDTDDEYPEFRFAIQEKFLEDHPDVSVVGGFLEEKFSDISHKKMITKIRRLPLEFDAVAFYAKRRNPLNHQTVMLRRADVLASGNYQDCAGFEDYHLWARMLQAGYRISNLDAVLASTEVAGDYFARRGGRQYSRSEYFFAGEMRRIGFHSWSQSLFFLTTRTPFRIVPTRIREWSYSHFLR